MSEAPRGTRSFPSPLPTPGTLDKAKGASPHGGGDRGSDAYIRRVGKGLILGLYAALRAIRLYPLENAAVVRSAEDLTALAKELLAHEHELEIRVSGEFVFINTVRLRLDLDNYASFSHLLAVFRASGVGSVKIQDPPTVRDWSRLLALLLVSSNDPPAARLESLQRKLDEQGLHVFEVGEPKEMGEDSATLEKSKEVAKKTYSQSVAVTKELMTSVRMGRSPNIKKIKRVVQGIVDQILNEEASLIGLTTIRDYDEYTFTHSVNVCIFSVALGKRLGFSKLQLYDLGMAALFHDIGKSRVPSEVINKADGLSEDEWRMVAAHPWMGALALFQLRGQQELPYRAMVVAHEHHMKMDLTGYPRPVRPRTMSMFSKIVAVADGFDAATSRRSYQTTPMSPAQVMMEMRDNPRRGMDPVVVKAFINLTGIYPVGTLVVLDTFELGVVHAVNTIPEMLSRPIVRVISDAQGNLLHPGSLVDLAEQQEDGVYLRTIIKTENPDRYGIRVGDYFL
ncbi:MAG TPA: HD domain-containing phosphohydrolase [Gemmatimonadaceae bacterium]|nr:HD domain-containing phosphohydrolase [Gemmatimonadaceae bacterium]